MPEPLQLFVVTGTSEFPFPRLIDAAVEAQMQAPQELRTVVQYGATSAPPTVEGMTAFAFCGGDEYRERLAAADVVAGHAGLGLVLDILIAGRPAILVPRRLAQREHVDDHQMQIVGAIDIEGVDVDLTERPQLRLHRLRALAATRRPPQPLGNPALSAAIAAELGIG